MTTKFEQFAGAVRDYPAFKAQFSSFCKMSEAALNDNPQLPNVRFSAHDGALGGDPPVAHMLVFDQRFIVRFHLIVLAAAEAGTEKQVGVLGVYLPMVSDEELMLWHTFFDIRGKVRDTFDARSAALSLSERSFLEKLLSEVADRYFSRLVHKFQPSALPPR